MLHNQPIPNKGLVSAGWHPWFIEKLEAEKIKSKLIETTSYKNVIALGECGIDRVITTPMEWQIEVFELHLNLARNFELPVIVHCVKAYSDLLYILKKSKFNQPVILHDFKGSPQLVKQLSGYNTFFSFGKSLWGNNKKINEILRIIPVDRFFLETDESTYSIEKIYLCAAEILGKNQEELKKQLYLNFKKIFGDGLVRPD